VVYGVGLRPLACWDCGFESRRGHGCLSLVSVVCCQVEVSATGRSLVQRSPTECVVSERDLETSTMKRPRPIRALEPWKKYILWIFLVSINAMSWSAQFIYLDYISLIVVGEESKLWNLPLFNFVRRCVFSCEQRVQTELKMWKGEICCYPCRTEISKTNYAGGHCVHPHFELKSLTCLPIISFPST
jgi:hypothetical protein